MRSRKRGKEVTGYYLEVICTKSATRDYFKVADISYMFFYFLRLSYTTQDLFC